MRFRMLFQRAVRNVLPNDPRHKTVNFSTRFCYVHRMKNSAICSCHVRENNFLNKDSTTFPDSFDFLRPLYHCLAAQGITLQTVDQAPLTSFDAFLFIDMPPRNDPALRHAIQMRKPRILILIENYFIRPRNHDYARLPEFTCAFTYDDVAVDTGLARKFNYTFALPMRIETEDLSSKCALACMMFTNRKRTPKYMTYYRRLQTIDFFEKNHPDDFDLYGHEWDRGTALFQTNHPNVHYHLRHLPLPRFRRPSWKGVSTNKLATFAPYRFVYCYENSEALPGYITEKIFDVMMAGSVPIYLGHPTTKRHIPENCYIDRAHFESEEALYRFIKSMPDDHYRRYLRAINTFISTSQSAEFHQSRWVEHLFQTLTQQCVLEHHHGAQ